ncbi:hypothetical protein [Spirillospora albida]|uniref:hypothetical protein n=1 Tax=Spirillospora albida TaxID=58123 RepID=UPI00068D1030|nr:hypothetical protein [Spirillospora albida]
MTTDPHDELGEILRRALHAEADSVIPADDGLDRIRARIAAGGGRRRFGLDRFGAVLGLDRIMVGWTRPILAMAAAVAIAGVGVTAGPQTIDLIQHSVGSGGPSGQGDGGSADGDAVSPPGPSAHDPGAGSAGGGASPSPRTPQHPAAATSPGGVPCTPAAGGTPSAAATPESPATTGATPCPTPSEPTSPSPSPSVSETPTSPPPTQPSTPPSSDAPQDGGAANGEQQGAAATP